MAYIHHPESVSADQQAHTPPTDPDEILCQESLTDLFSFVELHSPLRVSSTSVAGTEPKPHNDMPGSTLTSDSDTELAPSLTPGTSLHTCVHKSPPVIPSSVVHTPGSKTSSPASSLAAESSQLTTHALTPSTYITSHINMLSYSSLQSTWHSRNWIITGW